MYFAKLLCFVFCMLISISYSTAQEQICYDTGNFTTNSSYANNRNSILSSLASNASANGGFFTATFGHDPDKIYALALCRGDTSSESCAGCINEMSQFIMNKCPNQKEAVSWAGGPLCFIRYANRSFFGTLDLDPGKIVTNPNNITSNLTHFDLIWESLMDRVATKASMGSSKLKFATEEAKLTTFEKIYALMQCTPDISQSDCDFCLRRSVSDFQNCCHGKQGGGVGRPNCFFRWDLYPFYNETVGSSPPPSLAPASNTISKDKDDGGIAAGTAVIIAFSAVVFMTMIAFAFFFLQRRKKKKEIINADRMYTMESLQFNFRTVRDATNNFSNDNKLGQGGFGAVYKGRLPNGQEIAVKRLSKNSGQGELEFKNEVLLLAKLQHRNLVRLLGFCLEGTERLLVYECVPNSSLDNYIFDPVNRSTLDWERRYKILGGIARGILYLHEDSRLRIIHRDLKASNILLDLDMNPKISDFGAARLFEIDQTQDDTRRIVGTFGYMAPEYVMRGQFSVKSDVFSFGVLVLEIISGRKSTCFDNGERGEDFLTWAWKNWKEGKALNLIDPMLRVGAIITSELLRCTHIGLLCVQENIADRPTMASVVLMLNSNSPSLPIPSLPSKFMHTATEQDSSEFMSH